MKLELNVSRGEKFYIHRRGKVLHEKRHLEDWRGVSSYLVLMCSDVLS